MRGLVLGKFLPPHLGHVHLCHAARAMCDELVIVVDAIAGHPISRAQRIAWMTELVPGARVVGLDVELPQDPSEDPAFWQLWREALGRAAGPVDRVFTSDAYGRRLAAELGATWIPIDPDRQAFAISGTAVRADPLGNWELLPRCVRAHYARRVSVFGPESTGKSTLAAVLAKMFDTIHVPEFARAYLESRGGVLARGDMEVIGAGQLAVEDAAAGDANRILVCDTDPLATVVWCEVLYGEAPAWLRERAFARRYALTLLCDVDLAWENDLVRYLPHDRAGFFARCEAALRAADRPYVIVRGLGEARTQAAIAAVKELT
jgi:HTH-type transcriptional regulator, transcriptional repressor of NAD biosynthesis genes